MLPVDASASRHISSAKVSYEAHAPASKPFNTAQIQADHQSRSAKMLNIQNQLQNVKDGTKNYLQLLHDYKELLELEVSDHARVSEHLQNNQATNETEKQQLKSLQADMQKTISGDNDGVADKMHDLGKGRKLANVPNDKTSVFQLARSAFGNHSNDSRTLKLNRDVFDSNSLGAAYAQRGLRDIDVVHKNDMVVIAGDQQSRSSALPSSLPAGKPTDAVPSGLPGLTNNAAFAKLKPTQQEVALNTYKDVLSNKTAMSPDELKTINDNLPALVTSDSFQKLDPGMRSAAIALLKDVAVKSNNYDQTSSIKDIQKIISMSSFAEIQPASTKIDVMNSYTRDANMRAETNKLLGEGWIPADKKALAMTTMVRVTHSLLYKEADASQRATLLANAHTLGTHHEFQSFNDDQRSAAIAKLTEHRNWAQKGVAAVGGWLGFGTTSTERGLIEGTALTDTLGAGRAVSADIKTPPTSNTQTGTSNLQAGAQATSAPSSTSNSTGIDTSYMTPAQRDLYTQNRMLFTQTFLETDISAESQQQFFQSLSDPDAAVMQELCHNDKVADLLYYGGTYAPEVGGVLKGLMEGASSSDSKSLWKREILGA